MGLVPAADSKMSPETRGGVGINIGPYQPSRSSNLGEHRQRGPAPPHHTAHMAQLPIPAPSSLKPIRATFLGYPPAAPALCNAGPPHAGVRG